MKPEDWQQLDKLFHSALERGPAARAAFLDEACAGDEALRQRVEALLAAHEQAGSFIESPAMEVEARGVAADPENKEAELANGETVSHYRIILPLGSGGMGDVYLAQDTVLSRQVALKLLPEHFTRDTDRLRRFQQEARAASALNHPNIITIYEIGQIDDRHFMATEFIDGETLRQNFFGEGGHTSGKPLRLRDVLNIAIQTADALAAAHEAGIVHRDIKPENIMVRRRDGYVKVLDFGLAKLTEGEVDSEAPTRAQIKTSAGVVMGTVTYMSPEQARGEQVDVRTDIWSLGVVLYEMVAGSAPFGRSTPSEVIALILEREPAPLARYAREVPSELERIVSKALTKDREERYQTAKDLLVDLRRLRQRLEVKAEVERLATPASGSESAVTTNGTETAVATTDEAPGLTQAEIVRRPSSIEHIASEIQQHRSSIGLAVAVVLLAATGFGYWFFVHRSSSARQIESIAVMPFVNDSGNADVDYLSDGMTEMLITSLSQLPNLNVKPRSSVFRYKGKEINPQTIGKELNVQAILNGRVVPRGQDLSVFVELIDVALDKVVWSQHYNRKEADLVSLQTEIARDVSSRLTKLSGADKAKVAKTYTTNPEANEPYLRGRFLLRRDLPQDLEKAVEYFQQAIALDPHFALAWVGLAAAYAPLSDLTTQAPRELMLKAKDAALHALSLDDQLVEAHIALGYILFAYDHDFAGAEREFKRALELSPADINAHLAYGELLTYLGRREESMSELRRALEIDPLSLGANNEYGLSLSFARRYDEAITQLKRTLELDNSYWPTHYSLAITYNMKGDYAESVAERVQINELVGHPQTAILMRESFAKGGWQGFLRAMTGKQKPPNLPHFIVATFLVELGEKDKALVILNQMYEDHNSKLTMRKVDPRLDPLRDDPRFQDLLRRVGFTP